MAEHGLQVPLVWAVLTKEADSCSYDCPSAEQLRQHPLTEDLSVSKADCSVVWLDARLPVIDPTVGVVIGQGSILALRSLDGARDEREAPGDEAARTPDLCLGRHLGIDGLRGLEHSLLEDHAGTGQVAGKAQVVDVNADQQGQRVLDGDRLGCQAEWVGNV